MKRLIFAGSILIAGLILSGCQSSTTASVPPAPPTANTTSEVVAHQPAASPTSKSTPVVAASPTPPITDEDKEVKSIDDQLNQLDSAKDFPAVSQSDLQQ